MNDKVESIIVVIVIVVCCKLMYGCVIRCEESILMMLPAARCLELNGEGRHQFVPFIYDVCVY
jgi:hypothetical protein